MLKILMILMIFVNLNEALMREGFGGLCNGERCDYDKKCIHYPDGPKCDSLVIGEGDPSRQKRTIVGGLIYCDEMSGCADRFICHLDPKIGGYCVPNDSTQ